jgi:hypothetical protein
LTIRLRDDCYRIPDICLKSLPYEKGRVLTRRDLAIEIVSPDDKVLEMLTKIGDYLAAGIPHIWVVDSYKRTVVEADHAGIAPSRHPKALDAFGRRSRFRGPLRATRRARTVIARTAESRVHSPSSR